MLLKISIWLLTLLGLVPVATIATAFHFLAHGAPSEPPEEARERAALLDRADPDTIVMSSIRLRGTQDISTPVYFRPWCIAIGVAGAVCLLIFTVFTFHIPTN